MPNPSEPFKKDLSLLFYDCVWNGQRNKIKRKTLCRPSEEGGLNMMDVNTFLETLMTKLLTDNNGGWLSLPQGLCARPGPTQPLWRYIPLF